MKHPREPFERLLDVFDASFKRAAEQYGFDFDPRVGHVSRALRLKNDKLKRGVFLDLKKHWMESDPIDPEVELNLGAWSFSRVLFKNFYKGRLSELILCVDEKLEQAVSELKEVSGERVEREGKPLKDFLE